MLRFFCFFLALSLSAAEALAQDHPTYRLLKLDEHIVKWGVASYGAGSSLTYTFIARETSFEDARNCRSMAPVDALLESSQIDRTAFEDAVARAFSLWQSSAGVTFTRSADPGAADILIGVDLDKRGWAHADVKAAPSPEEIRHITRGLICLNADKPWKIGFGSNADAQDIQYTMTHEIGHAIGLNHASPNGQVMSFIYGEDFMELQPGDIAGVQALYGAPALSNAAVASASASYTP